MYRIDDKEFKNKKDYELYLKFIKVKERLRKRVKRGIKKIEELKIMEGVKKGRRMKEIIEEIIREEREEEKNKEREEKKEKELKE